MNASETSLLVKVTPTKIILTISDRNNFEEVTIHMTAKAARTLARAISLAAARLERAQGVRPNPLRLVR